MTDREVLSTPDSDTFSPVSAALEELPSSVARGGVYLLSAVLVAALVWGSLSLVGEYVASSATVFPASDLPIVQSTYGGLVVAQPVRDGAQVAQGDTLLRVRSEQLLIARRELVQRQQELVLAQQMAEHTSREVVPALARQIDSKQQRLSTLDSLREALHFKRTSVGAQIDLERESLTSRKQLADRRVGMNASLRKQGAASESQLMFLRQEALEVDSELARLGSRELSTSVAVNEELIRLELQIDTLREEIITLEQRQRELQQEAAAQISRAEILVQRASAMAVARGVSLAAERTGRDDLHIVTAPATGTLTDVNVTNPGQVIEAGAVLGKIVPSETELGVRLRVANRDVSRVAVGDRVRIKINAFPYTDFGVLEGRIVRLAPAPSSRRDNTAEVGSFVAEASLEQDYFVVDGARQRLLPGMVGVAEIRVGTRRLITRFFKPLEDLFEPETAQR